MDCYRWLNLLIIGPKGNCRKSGAIEQRRLGIGLPRVAGGLGARHIAGGYDYRIAVNLGVSPKPFAVVAGNGEFTQLVSFDHEAAIGVFEMQSQGTRQCFEPVEGRDRS